MAVFTTGGMGSDRHFARQQSSGPNVPFTGLVTSAKSKLEMNCSARARDRASVMLWTMIWDEELASRLTTSITSWQKAHPALNTSTLRLLSMAVLGRRKALSLIVLDVR